ncbi:MAG TPA: putative Ig domain-containing protein, partial [Ferruginibacter sp.]|nr:putative Ig domain-containing protein [Ferruginibacter sp.]
MITSATAATGIVGSAFSYTIKALNTPTSFSTSSLPTGLSVNTTTGVISGTPTVAGYYADTITATNSSGSVSQTLAISIISAWSLTGNSGTSGGTNYIGTNDNQDIVFKRNGTVSGLLDLWYNNTSWGVNSLASNPTGTFNTAIGVSSLALDTSGVANTALGYASLLATRQGGYNTGIGMGALGSNTAGNNNTAVGQVAATSIAGSSSYNTAIGSSSLRYATSVSYNTVMGYQSLYNATTGSGNTVVGANALVTTKTGAGNTTLGYLADVTDTSASFSISLGYKALASSNQLAISDSIHTIKAKGLTTGRGYVLTDTAGNGNLSLQPNAGSTAWSLTGNSGTSSTTNFIGTKDNQDVVFKRDNKIAGLLDSSLQNTSWGVTTLLNNTTGNENSAVGYNSLNSNTSGYNNAAVGAGTLQANQSGYDNTAVGAFSELTDNTGHDNTGVGAWALYKNQGTIDNSAFGSSSLIANTLGQYNTAVGFASLGANTKGNNNTGVGYLSLGVTTRGNNNTALGYQATTTDSLVSNSIALGYNAVASSGQFAISDSIHTIKAKGLPTGAGYVLTDVSGNGNLSLQPNAGSTAWNLNGNIATAGSNYIGSSNNVSVRFRTNNTEKMIIDSLGRVGIGVTNITDTSYKLYVEKGIRTRRVKVDISSWSDFVFDNNYQLPSLTSVENYIQQNKHLPDVPSAMDVQKNGIDLGENQKILLQKIEELTLYIIDQNKAMDNQNKAI